VEILCLELTFFAPGYNHTQIIPYLCRSRDVKITPTSQVTTHVIKAIKIKTFPLPATLKNSVDLSPQTGCRPPLGYGSQSERPPTPIRRLVDAG